MHQPEIYISVSEGTFDHAAVEYGVRLARDMKLSAVFYDEENLSSPYGSEFMTTGQLDDFDNKYKERLEEARYQLEGLTQKHQSIWSQVHYRMETGIYQEQLVETINEENPLLVIFPLLQEYSTTRDWLGSFETKLAEALAPPVLFIPDHYKYHKWTKMHYFGNLSDEHAPMPDALKALAKKADLKITSEVIPEDSNSSTVLDILRQTQTDVFIFKIQEKSFLQRFFGGPNLEKIVMESNFPIMIY